MASALLGARLGKTILVPHRPIYYITVPDKILRVEFILMNPWFNLSQQELEKLFVEELNLFRNDIEAVVRFAYTESAIHEIASRNKSVLLALNKAPAFWNTILGSLTVSTFISLGRVFDNVGGDRHSIDLLFRILTQNRSLISRKNYISRWVKDHDASHPISPAYLEHIYEMTAEDWKELRNVKRALTKEYEDNYGPVRHMLAHRIQTDNTKIKLIMSKAEVRKLEKFCAKLRNLHEGLWQAYFNGKGPITPLRTGRYSSRSFVRTQTIPYKPIILPSIYVDSAKEAMKLIRLGLSK